MTLPESWIISPRKFSSHGRCTQNRLPELSISISPCHTLGSIPCIFHFGSSVMPKRLKLQRASRFDSFDPKLLYNEIFILSYSIIVLSESASGILPYFTVPASGSRSTPERRFHGTLSYALKNASSLFPCPAFFSLVKK